MARCRFNSEKWLQVALRISRARCRAAFQCEGNRYARVLDMHQRSRFARSKEAARLPRLRQTMHAGTSARRHHGFSRGRVRGLLRLWPPFGGEKWRAELRRRRSHELIPHCGSWFTMNQGLAGSRPCINKFAENFRDKILRKCGESVEMKEKFFAKYAAEIETLSREMADLFSRTHKPLSLCKRWWPRENRSAISRLKVSISAAYLAKNFSFI